MRARGEKLLVEILRNSGNKSRTKAQPVVRKGETDFLYCPSAPATTKTVTIEGIRARKTVFETRRKTIYSERGWRRFLSRTPLATPRTGVTIALNWNCIHYTFLCFKMKVLLADHFSLPHFVLRFLRCKLHVVTVDVVVASFFAVLLHHRAQMPVILHPLVPFMDIAMPLLHRTSMLRVCVNYYTRAVYIRVVYIRITSTRPGRPYYYLDVPVVNFGVSCSSCEV